MEDQNLINEYYLLNVFNDEYNIAKNEDFKQFSDLSECSENIIINLEKKNFNNKFKKYYSFIKHLNNTVPKINDDFIEIFSQNLENMTVIHKYYKNSETRKFLLEWLKNNNFNEEYDEEKSKIEQIKNELNWIIPNKVIENFCQHINEKSNTLVQVINNFEDHKVKKILSKYAIKSYDNNEFLISFYSKLLINEKTTDINEINELITLIKNHHLKNPILLSCLWELSMKIEIYIKKFKKI